MGNAAASMARYQEGGSVRGPGTPTSDSVPVRLSSGEFVVPADSVKKIGLSALRALVAATHKHVMPNGNAKLRRMANGGLVDDAAAQAPAPAVVPPPVPAPPPAAAPAAPAQTQYERDTAARNATVVSAFAPAAGRMAAPIAAAPAAAPPTIAAAAPATAVSTLAAATPAPTAAPAAPTAPINGIGGSAVRDINLRAAATTAAMPAAQARLDAVGSGGGLHFANGGYVGTAVRRMANGGSVDDDPKAQPSVPYGQQLANVAGAVGSGVARVAKEVFSAPPDANSPSGYGLNRVGSGPNDAVVAAAPSAARALAAGVPASTAGAGRGALNPPTVGATQRPDLAAMPNLAGSTGTAVDGAPGVRKFVQGGNTLYSNVAGADNDALMSGKPGVQVAPGAPAQSGAVAALAASAAVPAQAPSGNAYIPGVTVPLTQYQQETAARNAGVTSVFLSRGISDREAARLANASQIASNNNATALGAAQIGADASRYGHDTAAGTAAARLATETPEIAARTGELAAQGKVRGGLAAAQQALLAAKTPDDRQTAEDNLRAILGKDRNFPEQIKATVVPPRVFADGTSSPGYVVQSNLRTGEAPTITRLAEPTQAATPMPSSKDKLVSGTVYQTSRGPAKWDGKQFVSQ